MEEITSENVEQTSENGWTDPTTGKFIKGNPGGGRPQGSLSIKTLVKQHLETHPDDLKEFIEHFIKENRELAWQMLEGRPPQKLGVEGELNQKHFIISRGVPGDELTLSTTSEPVSSDNTENTV